MFARLFLVCFCSFRMRIASAVARASGLGLQRSPASLRVSLPMSIPRSADFSVVGAVTHAAWSSASSVRLLHVSSASAEQASSTSNAASSEQGTPHATPTAKPRAASGSAHSRKTRHYLLAAFVGGPLAFLAYLAYKYRSVEEAIADLATVFEGVKEAGVTDPTIDELQVRFSRCWRACSWFAAVGGEIQLHRLVLH